MSKDKVLIAITKDCEMIARDNQGLFLSISKEHITWESSNWIEIEIKNDSNLGQKLKRGH